MAPRIGTVTRTRFLLVGLLAAGCGGNSTAAGPPAHPTVKVTQDAQHVHLHFTNPNKHWKVRDLKYDIDFRDKNGSFLASYLVGDRNPAGGLCCVIASLPAGGSVTVDLPPVKGVIADISVSYVGGHWTKTG